MGNKDIKQKTIFDYLNDSNKLLKLIHEDDFSEDILCVDLANILMLSSIVCFVQCIKDKNKFREALDFSYNLLADEFCSIQDKRDVIGKIAELREERIKKQQGI